MKILIDARLYGLENAGLGRYLINLISSLQKIDSKNDYSILLRKKYFNALNLNKNFKKVLIDVRHYSLKEQFLLPKIVRKENPDLVHYPHFNTPIFCRKPFVVTIHDLLMHKQKGKDATTLFLPEYFIKRLFYKLVFRYAVKKSKTIIVPSEFVKKEIQDYYNVDKSKIKVTYEGVSFDFQSSSRLQKLREKYSFETPYVLYVGNAYPHKNLIKAIKAVKGVNESKKLSFVIVSSRNVFVERMQNFVMKNNLNKFVKVLNFVEDKDLAALYKNALAFVYPSLSEGFGLQGLEAMSQKTPCLASDIKAFREIYEDNAIFFNPKDVFSIKNSILKASNMPEKQKKQLVNKAYEFVKKYSWDKMAELTLKAYESSISI
ncbi:glycosyltransferase family 4 protein [Patescibacteria group bacterium]